MLDLILHQEVIAGLVIVGSALIAGKSLMHYVKEAETLSRKLNTVEVTLMKLKEALPEKQKEVEELTKQIKEIRPLEQEMYRYYRQLTDIKTEAEKSVLEEEIEEDSHEIKRRAMEF